NCLNSIWKDYLVLAIPRLISTQPKYMKNILKELKTMETSQQLKLINSQTSTVSWGASLAKLSASLVNDRGLKIPEEHYSLTLPGFCEQNGLDFSYLKMLKGLSITTMAELLKPSSK